MALPVRDAKSGRFVKATAKPAVPSPRDVFKPRIPEQSKPTDRRAHGYKGPLTRDDLATARVPSPAEMRSRRA
jgi:hypothetical protein